MPEAVLAGVQHDAQGVAFEPPHAAAAVYLAAPTTYTTGVSLRLDGGISGVRIVR